MFTHQPLRFAFGRCCVLRFSEEKPFAGGVVWLTLDCTEARRWVEVLFVLSLYAPNNERGHFLIPTQKLSLIHI